MSQASMARWLDGSIGGFRRAAFLWGVLLLTLTSWPKPPEVPVASDIPDFDKFVHVVLYGVEAFLLYYAIAWQRSAGRLARVIAITGTMAVWGTLDELHQYWIPGRSMEGGDVMADVTGAALGAAVASALRRPAPSAERSPAEGGPDPSLRSG